MPSSIPYNSTSLILGNIFDMRLLSMIKSIEGLTSKIDAAQDRMNSFIAMKRSLAMTINELTDMGVDITELKAKLTELDSSISKAAQDYLGARITNETSIQQIREQISELEVSDALESPVDFSQSAIKYLPLSSESLKLDAQYFSFDSESEDDTIADIEKYVREATSNLGSQSGEISKTAASQLSQQKQNHSLAGTLIITASCTHRNVAVMEPLIVDPDKALSIWNSTYADAAAQIAAKDPSQVKSAAEANDSTGSISIISGIVYGSSFVGMVHFLKTEMSALGDIDATQIQEKLKIGGWVESLSGGFGIDSSVAGEVKKMLNTQGMTSHVSLIVMGAAPAISANKLKSGISSLLTTGTSKVRDVIATAEPVKSTKGETIDSVATDATAGSRVLAMQKATNQSIIRELGRLDAESNNVIDINSMMAAFENYLQSVKGGSGSAGAPINFYLKKLTRAQVAQLWLDKYYPEGLVAKPVAAAMKSAQPLN